jgi:CheY-like chemotaxis protein
MRMEKHKILAVDDESEARLLISRQLRRIGIDKIVLREEGKRALDDEACQLDLKQLTIGLPRVRAFQKKVSSLKIHY